MLQDGVARPAARGSRSWNQEGMGCVCVSMRVALVKGGRGKGIVLERNVMEERAAWWKGRMERSIEESWAWERIRVWRSEWDIVEVGGEKKEGKEWL